MEREKGEVPFVYMGLLEGYNGTAIVQTDWYIEMNYANCISRFLKSHGWDIVSNEKDTTPTIHRTKVDIGWDATGRKIN